MEGTLDLVFTAALVGALLVSGGVALLLLPWTDGETDDAARALRALAARALSAVGVGVVRTVRG